MRQLNEYLSTKVHVGEHDKFPNNFDLDEIESFLYDNDFRKCNSLLDSNIKNTELGHIANYIANNTPYSSINNVLTKILYIKEVDSLVYGCMMTHEGNKNKLICHFISYDAGAQTMDILSYNSTIAFDLRKIYRSYQIDSINVYQKDIKSYDSFKKEIDFILHQ